MAEPQKPTTPVLKRCGEAVTVLRLPKAYVPLFGSHETLITADCPAKMKGGGLLVDAMALHPAGVAVKYQGEVILVGTFDYARLAKSEQ